MAELNDIRANGQHRVRSRASVCRPAPRRHGCNDWRLAARLGFIGRHRRATRPPKIAKTPRGPARPRAIRWHGRRIVGGLLYVVCDGGTEREIIKRMKVITKKSCPDLFEKVLAGEKTFDMRVADFDIQPGDILEQIEVNYDGAPTDRRVRHVVGEVLRTKEVDFWKQEDIDQYGYQVISLAKRVD